MAQGNAGSIYVDLLLRDSNYVQGLRRASSQTQNATSAISSSLKSVAISFASAFSVRELVRYSDEYKNLQNRLSLVSTSSEDFARTQQRLFDIAQLTRTDLSATVTLYQRLTSAVKGLGISQEEILTFTEQLNKQLITAGVSSQESAAAIFQLTQAFNKGKLDGDEFRTILETAPPILEALSVSLNKTRGEILAMAADGKLAPKVLVDAVNSMAEVTNRRFGDFNVTIGQAFTNLNNSIINYVGNSESFNSATSLMAESVQDLSGFIDTLSQDANSTRVALYGLTAYLIEFYKKYNEIALNVQKSTDFFGLREGSIKETEDRIRSAQEALDRIGQELLDLEDEQKRAVESGRASNATPSSEGTKSPLAPSKEDLKRIKDLNSSYKQYEQYIRGVKLEVIQLESAEADLEVLRKSGKISQEQMNLALERYKEHLDSSKEKTNIWAIDVEAAAKRASENIQDSLADFLFDPFEKGLDGMLMGFVNTLRRMAAEAASVQILGGLFGKGGIGSSGGILSGIGDSFAGLFANGGHIPAGQWGVVGERGPEIAFGGATGQSIIPMTEGSGGGVSVNIINNSNNASVSTRQGTNGASLDVLIDQAVAQNIGTPGSRTNQALGNFNQRSLTKR